MARKVLTDEQFKICEEMREQGKYYSEIAAVFGVATSTVGSRFNRKTNPNARIDRDRCKESTVELNTAKQVRRKAAVTKFFESLCMGDTVRIHEETNDKKHKPRNVQGEVMYKDKNKFTLQKKINRETFDFNYLMMDMVKVAKV